MKSIFISSTFKDMQAERDYLHQIVFPKVRSVISNYGEDLEDVDLRWGVDTLNLSEQESGQMVISICIDAIDRCKPYVIVLLGERYGWIPDIETIGEIYDNRVVPFMKRALSITDLEIQYGALGTEEERAHCIFCFRSNSFVSQVPENYRGIYEAETPVHREKLEKLKSDIRELSDISIVDYEVDWDEENTCVTGLEYFGKQVGQLLTDKILKELGGVPLTDSDRRMLDVKRVSDKFLRTYNNRLGVERKIYEQMMLRNRDVCIYGEPGIGKSALLTALYEQCKRRGYPALLYYAKNQNCSQIETFLNTVEPIIQKVIEDEMDKQFFLFVDDTQLFGPLYDEWFLRLAEQKKEKQVLKQKIIVVYTCPEKPRVSWGMPWDIPWDKIGQNTEKWLKRSDEENKELVYSVVLPDENESMGIGNIIELKELSKDEAFCMIQSVAKNRGKTIDPVVVDEIFNKENYKNPRYLSMLLQFLFHMNGRDFEKAEQIATGMEGISKYMQHLVQEAPEDIEDLILKIIEKVVDGVTVGYEEVTHQWEFLKLLSVANGGLTTEELLMLCPAARPIEVEKLLLALYEMVEIGIDGRWSYAHHDVQCCVKRLLNTEEKAYINKVWTVKKDNSRVPTYHLCCLAAAGDKLEMAQILGHRIEQGILEIEEQIVLYGRLFQEGYSEFLMKLLEENNEIFNQSFVKLAIQESFRWMMEINMLNETLIKILPCTKSKQLAFEIGLLLNRIVWLEACDRKEVSESELIVLERYTELENPSEEEKGWMRTFIFQAIARKTTEAEQMLDIYKALDDDVRLLSIIYELQILENVDAFDKLYTFCLEQEQKSGEKEADILFYELGKHLLVRKSMKRREYNKATPYVEPLYIKAKEEFRKRKCYENAGFLYEALDYCKKLAKGQERQIYIKEQIQLASWMRSTYMHTQTDWLLSKAYEYYADRAKTVIDHDISRILNEQRQKQFWGSYGQDDLIITLTNEAEALIERGSHLYYDLICKYIEQAYSLIQTALEETKENYYVEREMMLDQIALRFYLEVEEMERVKELAERLSINLRNKPKQTTDRGKYSHDTCKRILLECLYKVGENDCVRKLAEELLESTSSLDATWIKKYHHEMGVLQIRLDSCYWECCCLRDEGKHEEALSKLWTATVEYIMKTSDVKYLNYKNIDKNVMRRKLEIDRLLAELFEIGEPEHAKKQWQTLYDEFEKSDFCCGSISKFKEEMIDEILLYLEIVCHVSTKNKYAKNVINYCVELEEYTRNNNLYYRPRILRLFIDIMNNPKKYCVTKVPWQVKNALIKALHLKWKIEKNHKSLDADEMKILGKLLYEREVREMRLYLDMPFYDAEEEQDSCRFFQETQMQMQQELAWQRFQKHYAIQKQIMEYIFVEKRQSLEIGALRERMGYTFFEAEQLTHIAPVNRGHFFLVLETGYEAFMNEKMNPKDKYLQALNTIKYMKKYSVIEYGEKQLWPQSILEHMAMLVHYRLCYEGVSKTSDEREYHIKFYEEMLRKTGDRVLDKKMLPLTFELYSKTTPNYGETKHCYLVTSMAGVIGGGYAQEDFSEEELYWILKLYQQMIETVDIDFWREKNRDNQHFMEGFINIQKVCEKLYNQKQDETIVSYIMDVGKRVEILYKETSNYKVKKEEIFRKQLYGIYITELKLLALEPSSRMVEIEAVYNQIKPLLGCREITDYEDLMDIVIRLGKKTAYQYSIIRKILEEIVVAKKRKTDR